MCFFLDLMKTEIPIKFSLRFNFKPSSFLLLFLLLAHIQFSLQFLICENCLTPFNGSYGAYASYTWGYIFRSGFEFMLALHMTLKQLPAEADSLSFSGGCR